MTNKNEDIEKTYRTFVLETNMLCSSCNNISTRFNKLIVSNKIVQYIFVCDLCGEQTNIQLSKHYIKEKLFESIHMNLEHDDYIKLLIMSHYHRRFVSKEDVFEDFVSELHNDLKKRRQSILYKIKKYARKYINKT